MRPHNGGHWGLAAVFLFRPVVPAVAQTVSVAETVFEDVDCDGVLNADELALGGMKIHLRGQAGRVPTLDSATTGTDGTYPFAGLSAGDYEVSGAALLLWRDLQVAPNCGAATLVRVTHGSLSLSASRGSRRIYLVVFWWRYAKFAASGQELRRIFAPATAENARAYPC